MTSQLTGLTARTTGAAFKSQISGLSAHTLAASGHSQLTGLSAMTVSSTLGHSQLSGLQAKTMTPSDAMAVLSGPTDGIEPGTPFTLTLAGSLGGPFISTAIAQTGGPPAVNFSVTNGVATGIAPVTKPLPENFPDDLAPVMEFTGTVINFNGADETILPVPVFPHLTWAADGTALFWHEATASGGQVPVVAAVGFSGSGSLSTVVAAKGKVAPAFTGSGSLSAVVSIPVASIQITTPLANANLVGDVTISATVAAGLGATAVEFEIGHPDLDPFPASKVGTTTTWTTPVPWHSDLSLHSNATTTTVMPGDYAYWIRARVTTPGGVLYSPYRKVYTNNHGTNGTGTVPVPNAAFNRVYGSNMTSAATFHAGFDIVYGNLDNPTRPSVTIVNESRVAGGKMAKVTMDEDHTRTDQAPDNDGIRWQGQSDRDYPSGLEIWVGATFMIPVSPLFPTPTTSHVSIMQTMVPIGNDFDLALRFMLDARIKAGTSGKTEMVAGHFYVDGNDRGPGEAGLLLDLPYNDWRGDPFDVVIGYGLSPNPRLGWIECRYRAPNDVNLTRYQFFDGSYRISAQTMPIGAVAARFDLQQYRSPLKWTEVTSYYGPLRTGTTPELVDPHSYA